MGGAYSPDFHWTSRLRGRAGLLPYENIDETHSSFTIDDRSGRFTELISRSGYKDAALWSRYPIYHIEVNTSEAGLDSAFCLDPYQVHKVSLAIFYLYSDSFAGLLLSAPFPGRRGLFVVYRISADN
jgi:hypothetical protein